MRSFPRETWMPKGVSRWSNIRLAMTLLGLVVTWPSLAQNPGASSGGTTLVSVHPSGAVDGHNLVFSLPQAPIDPSAVLVIANGRKLLAGRDYTVKGEELNFIPSSVPHQGDVITVCFHGGGQPVAVEKTAERASQEMQDLSRQMLVEAILREGSAEPTSGQLPAHIDAVVGASSTPAVQRVRSLSFLRNRLKKSGGESREESSPRVPTLTGFDGLGDVGVSPVAGMQSEQEITRQAQNGQSTGTTAYRSIAMIQERLLEVDKAGGAGKQRKDKQ